MSKNNKKVEKETRRLMEGITDLVKKKGDRYKFKSKNKKLVKKVKKTCIHWIMRKGKPVPTVIHDPNNPLNWKCTICGKTFPIKPASHDEYVEICDRMLEFVDQMQFWSVKLGGDADDTKMFIRLKESVPRFKKVTKQIIKQMNRRDSWDKNRERADVMSQFDAYSGFNYRS